MTISSVSNPVSAYLAQSATTGSSSNTGVPATSSLASPTPVVSVVDTASTAPQASYVVTLSGDAPHPSKIIDVTATIEKTPLTVAWAPQLFAQADSSGDNKLTLAEFATQLKRVGVDTTTAKQLFDAFDTSKKSTLSIDDFVDGVKKDFDSGSQLFTRLIDTYTTGQDGHDDVVATDKFLNEGLAQGNRYWAGKR